MSRIYQLMFPLLSLTGLFACTNQYNIDGNSSIAGLDGQKLYLRMTVDGVTRNVCLDSCEVVHGCFNFGGAVDSVAMVELYMGNYPMMPVVLEHGELFVQMDNTQQSVSGGPLNDRLNTFLCKHSRLENELWDIDRRARNMIYEGKSLEQIVLTLDPIRNNLISNMQQLETKFVKDNYDNALGPGYFIRLCDKMSDAAAPNDQIRDILEDAPTEFLNHPYVRHYLHLYGATPEMIQQDNFNRKARAIVNDSTMSDRKKVKALKQLTNK